MTATYLIDVLHVDQADSLTELRAAVAAELLRIGMHRSVEVVVSDAGLDLKGPTVAVLLGSPVAATDASLERHLDAVLSRGTVVIPVVRSLTNFTREVPPALHLINGFEWATRDSATNLARVLLEELNLEDRERRVFISHKRDDGLGAAEQLHDHLAHRGFRAFIDRFAIRTGVDVQRAIADSLEEHAFLLLLETPLAHTSDWVFDEIDYALSHTMATLVVRWPAADPVPGSHGLPRLEVDPSELLMDEHGYQILTDSALDRLDSELEATHASGLVRRRRMLLRSVEEAALARGATACVPLPGWRLQVERPTGRTVVGITPRLPIAEDLRQLDIARVEAGASADGLLVHSARALSARRQDLLSWITDSRSLHLSPENAVGDWW